MVRAHKEGVPFTDSTMTHLRSELLISIERGNQDGWGPALLGWPRGRTGQPDRIPADDIIAKMPDGSGSEVPIEFAGIAASPLGDARYAVFAAARDAGRVWLATPGAIWRHAADPAR